MAEVIISPLLQVIFEKLASPVLRKLEFSRDYMKEFEKLMSTLPVIQEVIEDAEEQQRKDKKVRGWLIELKEVAYDVDDLLDELTTQVLHTKAKKNTVCVPCLALEPFSSYYHTPRKVKKLRGRLDDIAREMSKFRFKNRTVEFERSLTIERRETGPYVDKSDVCGRKEDVNLIVTMLLSATICNHRVSVMPIVGLGGIGKTTVAQLAYSDQRVTNHFDIQMWASLYDNFNVRKILTEILEYATQNKNASSQIGILQSQLSESLCGKRYLLVLDDVWNEDQEEWEKLKYPLSSGADGSKIIITTRSEKVASIMGTMATYILEPLTEDECWSLFKQRAFAEGEEEKYPKLLIIGKEIVKKCQGVPFAAKILGSLMRFKREQSEWSHVQGSELWNLGEDENRILSALQLSYNHLPSHLKQCFTYCSVLPKKFQISKQKLIRLWIAHGLIQSPGDTFSTKKMEDTGNEYFNDLLLMSFFQAVSRYEDSSEPEYKMHDLIHNLAKFLAGDEVLVKGHEGAPVNRAQVQPTFMLFKSNARIRHASVFCNLKSRQVPEALYDAKKLRGLRLFSLSNDFCKSFPAMIKVFKHLKVLDLKGCGIRRLHKSIGDLIYLRYLDLSDTDLETLPKTVCHLRNLQTLDLSGCHYLMNLPRGINKLINLRHLIIEGCVKLTRMPSVRNLLNLQTLSVFIVGQTFEEGLFQLLHLDLQGELQIKNLENASNIIPDLCLKHKKLSSLRLSWGKDDTKMEGFSREFSEGHQANQSKTEALVTCLQPNDSLRKLHLNDYLGVSFPKWMSNTMLPNITELVLRNCRKCKNLPTLGQLPLLKVLNMQGLEAVVEITSAFYGGDHDQITFPALKQLTITKCPNLETWETPVAREALTCLNRLTIIGCPRLTKMPWFPSLQHLELRNCNARILRSAAELNSLSNLIIDIIPELSYLPQGLLQNSSSLASLTISSCPQLCSLPWDLRNLVALKSLTIRWCEELTALPREIRNLTSLESLEITECPSLISLPEEGIQGLKSLRSLSIENCCNLTCLPKGITQLISLEHLMIMYCPNLAALPDGLQCLSALRSINILSCHEFSSLPEGLGHVKTLQSLEICSCPKLMELPEWVGNLASLRSLTVSDCRNIKSLPRSLNRLKMLQHLSIRDCPDLEEQFKRQRGDPCGDISHIPYIYIGTST